MSDLLETMFKELGSTTLPEAGARVGASPEATQAVASAAIPTLVQALARNASQPAGASALAQTLDAHHAPNLMDQLGPLLGGAGGGGLGALLAAGAASSSTPAAGSGGAPPGGEAAALQALFGSTGLGAMLGGGGGGLGAMLGGAGGGDAAALGALLGAAGGGGGLGALLGAVGGGGGLGSLLGAAAGAMGGGAGATSLPPALRGDKIVGHLLGGGQAQATNDIAAKSGVDPSTVAALLPVLAPMVMSALGTQKKESGMDANGLAAFLGGEAQKVAPPAAAPAQPGIASRLFGRFFGR